MTHHKNDPAKVYKSVLLIHKVAQSSPLSNYRTYSSPSRDILNKVLSDTWVLLSRDSYLTGLPGKDISVFVNSSGDSIA